MGRYRYVHFYPEDFLVGAQALTDEQCAAYVRILAKLYDLDGELPNDPHFLKHLLNKSSVRPVKRVVEQLIALGKLRLDERGMLRNNRVDYELTRRRSWKKFDPKLEPNIPPNSSETSPDPRQENGTNTTRAHAGAHAGTPDTRNHIRENPLSHSTASARGNEPQEGLQSYLWRKLQEAKLERHDREIEHDPTQAPSDQD